MNKYTAIVTLVALFFSAELFSSKRDYKGSSQDETARPGSIFYPTSPSRPHPNYIKLNYMFCLGCFLQRIDSKGKCNGVDKELLRHIPSEGPTCFAVYCEYKWPTFYNLYLSHKNLRYRPCFIDHLEYCDKYEKCCCYWPEYSPKAAQINDEAYDLFYDFVSNTMFGLDLLDDCEQGALFRTSEYSFRSFRSITLSIITYQFRFSHYYYAYQDILKWSRLKYTETEVAYIKDRLELILDCLYPKFLDLYSDCSMKHTNSLIEEEKIFIKFLLRDVFQDSINQHAPHSIFGESGIIEKGKSPKNKKKKNKKKKHSSEEMIMPSRTKFFEGLKRNKDRSEFFFHSVSEDLLLEEGATYNDYLLYDNAINVITKSLNKNPLDIDSYFERAIAYFEKGQFDAALNDYQKGQKLRSPSVVEKGIGELCVQYLDLQNNSIEFSRGLIIGSLNGASTSAVEFIPSVVQSICGLTHGLWRFVCSPEEISREFLIAAYDMGVYLSSLDSKECLLLVVPEMRELSTNWKLMDALEKGKKIGFIIGKYGIDVFTSSISSIRGIQKLQSLKKANVALTLEMCASSKAKKAIILEESAKYAGIRTAIVQSTKKGKIVPRNANVQPHIMQQKHAWDKVIAKSGNAEEDFKKVIAFLEEHSIMDKGCIKGAPQYFPQSAPKIVRTSHKKIIDNIEVEAIFETYLETGEMFLQNAWVVTR